MIYKFFWLFVILAANQVLAKKKKGNQKIVYPEVSSHKRPNNIEPLLYCESCRAVVFLSVKTLKGSKSEADIVDTIERLCHVDNYSPELRYAPPYMADTC